jgi:hypothetical protein
MNSLLDLPTRNGNGHLNGHIGNGAALHAPTPSPPTLPHEDLMLLVERNLYRLLAELPPGWPAGTINVDVAGHGTAARLWLGPPAALPAAQTSGDDLSAREREAFAVVKAEVARLGRRVIGREIQEAMRAKGLRWSASTVNTALADLVARGLLVNDNDKRGYGLTDK